MTNSFTFTGALRSLSLVAGLGLVSVSAPQAQEYSAPDEPLAAGSTLVAPEVPTLEGSTLKVQPLVVQASTEISMEPREIKLPSELPSGNAVNDTIWFDWYPARGLASQRGPAAILIHPLQRQKQSLMHRYAHYLSARGISAAVLTLPYHGRRLPKDDVSVRHFVNSDTKEVVRAFKQSVADVRTVTDWLSTQDAVDSERLGAVGVSVGAIIVHLAMGQDARLKAGVASLGGGDIAENYRRSPFAQWKLVLRLFGISGDRGDIADGDLDLLAEVDPLTYADRNLPRRVLMIQAARDVVIPPRSAEVLWEKLGRPPIQWVDTNHFAAIDLTGDSTARASVAYLKSVWAGQPLAPRDIPKVRAPTLKAGFVMNLDSVVTPAVQWQFFSLGTRQHRSLIGANAGMSGRGPFVGIAASITSHFDLGLGRRLGGDRFTPYASLHFVY